MKPARAAICFCFCVGLFVGSGFGAEAIVVPLTNAQPLAANAGRVLEALEFFGGPLEGNVARELRAAMEAKDGEKIQQALDGQALFVVTINPESRVKTQRGGGKAVLQQAGFTPVLVKVINQSSVTKELRIVSPQAGAGYGGGREVWGERVERAGV